MFYEINVSYNNKHFFATHERSLTSKEKLYKAYKIFKEKFPEEEGYNITATRIETYGKFINFDEV